MSNLNKTIITEYVPNKIPKGERVFNLLWAFGLICYGVWGLVKGELWIPALRGGDGLIVTGFSLVLMLIAILVGVLNLLIPVFDHYDRRDNESMYRLLSNVFTGVSVFLIVLSTSIAYGYI